MDQQDGSASSWPNLAEDLDLDLDLNLDLDLCQPPGSTVQRVITVPSSASGPSIAIPASNVAPSSSIVTSNNPAVNPDFESNENVTVICKAESEATHTSDTLVHQPSEPSEAQAVEIPTNSDATSTHSSNAAQIPAPTKPTAVQITGATSAGQPITYMLPSNIISGLSLKSGKIQIQLPPSNSTPAAVNVASTMTPVNSSVPAGQATITQLKPASTTPTVQSKSTFVPIAPANKSTPSAGQTAKISIPGSKSSSPQVIMLPADVLSGFKGKIHIQVPQSASGSTSGGGSGTIAVTAIGNSARQVPVSSSNASTAKFVPIAPSPSVGRTSTVSASTVTTAQIVSSKPGQPQVIMLPSNIFSQMRTSHKIQIQVPSSAISTSGGSGTINITSLSASGQKQNLSTPSRSYVPIAPSPVSHPAIHNTSSNVTSRDFGGFIKGPQPNGSTSKAGILGIGGPSLPDDANRQRKPCNCTKSQCLKLYCDCFANGEFCSQCNCTNCSNNLEHEDERQKAVRQCLERNPQAFHPKIGKGRSTGDVTERRHTKGCNCRRSGCLKNYCECYEAKILCSELCKCCGCKNYEDSFERRSLQLMNPLDGESKHGLQTAAKLTSWTNDFVS